MDISWKSIVITSSVIEVSMQHKVELPVLGCVIPSQQKSKSIVFNHYSAKARVTRLKAELAKIRRYHASLSAIIVL